MLRAKDPTLSKWRRDHPADTAKVGVSLDLQAGGSSSSTSPSPQGLPPPPLPQTPGGLVVLEADEGDFKQVVPLLVANGVEDIDARRCVCVCVGVGVQCSEAEA